MGALDDGWVIYGNGVDSPYFTVGKSIKFDTKKG